MKNPYDVNIEELEESKEVTDKTEILKLRLASEFVRVSSKMSSQEIMEQTGLDKSDLSRLRVGNADRFSIDRIVSLLAALGFEATVRVKKNQAS